MPIKHTRPKVQKFDNGFIIEQTAMGPAEGKVRRLAVLHAYSQSTLLTGKLSSSCGRPDTCSSGAVCM